MAETGQTTPKLICKNLWKVFGTTPRRVIEALASGQSKERVLAETGHVMAVRDVSFEVYPGETFVVMGLSGSGKSTLLRCLSRLIEPTQGQVTVDGQNLSAADKHMLREIRRHKMSMVFQHCGVNAKLLGAQRYLLSRSDR